jgi:PAS domain S-box-containing protein
MGKLREKIRSSGTGNKVQSVAGDPAALLEKVLSGSSQEAVVGALISRLQFTDYSIADLIRDAAELKQKLTSSEMPLEGVLDSWTTLDRAIGRCLMRTSLSYERFIENTLHAFCEFDRGGTITYANAKMLADIPDCIGMELASLFGKIANEVYTASAKADQPQLYEFELKTAVGHHPVLVEFGRIDETVDGNGYALLVDMSQLVDAERKAIEAAPLGMVKVDAQQRILYANRKVLDLIGQGFNEVIGSDIRRFVTDQRSSEEVSRQIAQRRKGHGGQYKILMTPHSGASVKVLVTSIPSFDGAGAVVGALITIQPIDHHIGRQEIAELVASEDQFAILFSKLLEIVQRFVPFDRAELRIYTAGVEYSRPICCYPNDRDSNFARWFLIPKEFRGWWNRHETWIDDISEYLAASEPGATVMKHPDTQHILKQGLRAMVGIPLFKEEKVNGALVLWSKQKGKYDVETKRSLERLALDQALHSVLNAYDRAERAFVLRLINDISTSADHKQLAKTVVNGLVGFYGFQYASIFKVNALRGHFTLLAQKTAKDSDFDVPEDFQWPLDDGLLGFAYARKAHAVLNDPDDSSEEAKRFKTIEPRKTKSELCVPILLRDRVLWMLNLEDGRTNAFTKPEVETIRDIVAQMLPTIDHLFQRLMLAEVLDRFPRGAVVMDVIGKILECSAEALLMFEQDSVLNDSLALFLEQPDILEKLRHPGTAPFSAVVRGAKGARTSVLLSSFTLSEEYDHIVVVMESADDLQWRRDFEPLRASLAEVAAQVRVPLSLVSTFVQELQRSVSDTERTELIQKAARQLSRIELTYDRVMASHDLNRLSSERPIEVNLHEILKLILDDLPKVSARPVRLRSKSASPVVFADAHRVHFALASMLAYLLRCRSSTAPITIKLRDVNGSIEVAMVATVRPLAEREALRQLVESARSQIALGEDVLERIAEQYGGSFERKDLPDGDVRLCFRLPLRQQAEAAIGEG